MEAPRSEMALANYIVELMRQGRFNEAEAACQDFMASLPGATAPLLLGAEIAIALGRHQVALDRLRTLIKEAKLPLQVQVVRHVCRLLLAAGDQETARDVLRSAVARSPNDFALLTDLGQVEELTGSTEAACAAYDAAARANPGHAAPFTYRAVMLLKREFGAPLKAEGAKRQEVNAAERISMRTLGLNGRFGNQLLQYAFLRCYALEHDLIAEVPDWIGRWLFDLDDPYPSSHLPIIEDREGSFARIVSDHSRHLANHDLLGFGIANTRYYRAHRGFIRSLFVPGRHLQPMADALTQDLRGRGNTLVALHLRRGDFGYGPFWIAPEDWYLCWLQSIWDKLDRPCLYIASDDKGMVERFAPFGPISSGDLGAGIPGAEFYTDFHALTQADIVATSNSTFSFVASMLNRQARTFMRPAAREQALVAFDPWDADVLLSRT